jgi:hypothetical protein
MVQEGRAAALVYLVRVQVALVVLEQFLEAALQTVVAAVLAEQQALMEIFQLLL